MDAPALLASVRGRLRRTVALGGTARLAAVLIAGVGAALLADRFLFLPGWLRLIVLLGLVATAAGIVWRRLVRPLRTPLSDRDLASFIERRVPALEGRLLTAVDGIALDAGELATLSAALPAGAERALVPASRLPRALLAAGGALAAAALVAVLAPAFWRDGLTRLALPLATHDWERACAFSIAPERAVIAIDEPAVILVERVRGADGAARISWSDETGNGSARQLPGASGPWRTAVPLGAGRWTVTVAGGDAHSASTAVLVVARPRLDAATTTLTPPAYSHLPTQELASPACQALPGSTLAFRLAVSAPEGRSVARLKANLGGQAIALTHTGGEWRGSTTVMASAELVVTAADADGIALHPAARFPVAVEPDRVPTVSLSGPRGDEAVGPHAKVAVTLEAGDDLGLAKLALSATPSGAPAAAEPRQLVREELDGRRAVTRRALVDVARLGGPGATISLLGRAEDGNDVNGPGVGTSAPLVLKIVAEDELRRDLERQLGEARDRVHQARGNLAPGLADAAKLPNAARTAGQDAARAAELLARIERRWAENGLEAERIAPAAEARAAAGTEAGPPLAQAAAGDELAARAGDAALDKAERALDRMLSDSDLTRIIAMLIEREQALHAETRTFVREHLTSQPDEAGKTRQADLAARQKDLAARTADAERRIVSGPASLDAAKAIVRSTTPSERLATAAGDIASSDRRARAPEAQQATIAALQRILEALRGGDQLADLARRAGELAERQERLADAIERGLPRDEAAREQDRLRQETERLAKDLEQKPDAQKSASAAGNAQQGAQSALAGGDRASAARDAGTAGELLRAAQRALDPKQDKQDKEKPDKSGPDVIALLRKLFDQQAKVLADSLPIDKRIGEDEPDFAAKRDLSGVAQLQDDILLQLREEGVKALDQQPIALTAVRRVEAAMDKVLTHLRRPALASRGLALERIALAELKRVIDIAASIQMAAEEGGGGGGGGGGGNQAPFPPAAELALLIARQAEIHAQAAAGRPVDTGAMQVELSKLIALVESATKPGSRPNVLMGRARRAAEGAAGLLASNDRGSNARHHMLASEEALRQILAEAKGSGSGGGGGGSGQPPPPSAGGGGGQPKPGGAQPGQAGQPGGNAQAGAGTTVAGNGEAGSAVRTDQESTALLQLPPERREQLRQAREQRLPAGALQLFERYLEKLEER